MLEIWLYPDFCVESGWIGKCCEMTSGNELSNCCPGKPLIRAAREQHKRLITGEEVFALQAVEQFVLYTGIRPDAELFARAAAHARGQSVH